MTDDTAKRATVYLQGYRCIELQTILEDEKGQYIFHQGQRVDCYPAKDTKDQSIAGVYIGSYPWIIFEPEKP